MQRFPSPDASRASASAARPLTGFPDPAACLSRLGGGAAFLFESGGTRGSRARWSLLGSQPIARFVSRGGRNRFRRHGLGETRVWREEPLAALRRALAAFPRVDAPPGFPFAGGAVGSFAYELGRRLLPIAPLAEDDLELPEISLFVYDRCLAFDHDARSLSALACAWGDDEGEARRKAELKASLLAEEMERLLALPGLAPTVSTLAGSGPRSPATVGFVPPATASASVGGSAPAAAAPSPPAGELLALRATLDGDAYRSAVARCREEILDGNAYELCLTTRFEAPWSGDSLALHAALRERNPAPFATFLRHPESVLVGASPERFLRVDAQGRVEARPIKGTRPRGGDRAADAALRAALRGSAKDRAENVMIVDLLRNDLHRVCEPGSVAVPELCALEEHPAVFQLVSTVTGELREGLDRLDLLASAFPGGSMTGAPKIAAMNLLESMEPRVRGVYSGCVGWLGFDGAMDLSIVIRSALIAGGRVSVGAGGAVVYDSDPDAEWEEARHKADAPLCALAAASGCEGYALADAVALSAGGR